MWTIREWERKQPVSSVFEQFQAHCHHPNGLTNRTLVSAFVSLWVGMTVANIHLLQVAPTLSLHSLSSHCMVFLFLLICFIPSNLASADPLVPLLAVCVWKTDGCVHLRVWLYVRLFVVVMFLFGQMLSQDWVCCVFYVFVWLVGVCVCDCVCVNSVYEQDILCDGSFAVWCEKQPIFELLAAWTESPVENELSQNLQKSDWFCLLC